MGDVVAHVIRITELVNRDCTLSCEVLERTSQEGLWEEEARDPIDVWGSSRNPFAQEVDSCIAVMDPGSEWLQGEEAS